jgi:hypothetical protein
MVITHEQCKFSMFGQLALFLINFSYFFWGLGIINYGLNFNYQGLTIKTIIND